MTTHVDTGTGKQYSFSVNEVRSTAIITHTWWTTHWPADTKEVTCVKNFAWRYNHQRQECKIVDVKEQILLIRSQCMALNSFYTFVFWLLCSTFIILSWPHRCTVFILNNSWCNWECTDVLQCYRIYLWVTDYSGSKLLVCLPVISPCTNKSRRRFLLAPAHLGSVIVFNQATGYATKPLGIQASISGACPKQGQIGRVAAGRASSTKIGGWGRIAD